MPARRSLYWRLNWYRQSELDGALLLGRLSRHVSDPYLVHQLIQHCADEARHALLWSRVLRVLDLPVVRIRRPYQSFYAEEGAAPRTLVETLALTHIFEQRVQEHFTSELADRSCPRVARCAFQAMLRDERRHLDWIARWLAERPEAAPILTRYRRADERIAARLTPFRERLWDIAGLGEEGAGEEDDHQPATEERHQAQSEHPA